MKRFKIAYYIIYALVTLLVFYLAGNLLNVLQTLKEWDWYQYISELPAMAGKFFYFLGFFMVTTLVVETFFTYHKLSETRRLKKQVNELKAELYDLQQKERQATHTTTADQAEMTTPAATGEDSINPESPYTDDRTDYK